MKDLIQEAENILENTFIYNNGDEFDFYSEGWLILNNAFDKKDDYYIYEIYSDLDWKSKLKSIREKYSKDDLTKLLVSCKVEYWPE